MHSGSATVASLAYLLILLQEGRLHGFGTLTCDHGWPTSSASRRNGHGLECRVMAKRGAAGSLQTSGLENEPHRPEDRQKTLSPENNSWQALIGDSSPSVFQPVWGSACMRNPRNKVQG